MGVSRVVRVGSPYNAVDLQEVDFEQQADTMYLAHLDYPLTKLTRTAHDAWSFSTVGIGPKLSPPTGLVVTAHIQNTDSENGGAAYFPQNARYCVTSIDQDGFEIHQVGSSLTPCPENRHHLTALRRFKPLIMPSNYLPSFPEASAWLSPQLTHIPAPISRTG